VGVGFVYNISVFIFERSIERRKTLTENNTTPLVSEIHTKQSINEENSRFVHG
jgi:hypothetical protein